MKKQRLQELAGIENVNNQISNPIVPTAYMQYNIINQDEEKINYKVRISSLSKTVINQIWTQIRLYQLGSIEEMNIDENRETFELIFKPTVDKSKILDILTSLFGDKINIEILEED